MSDYLAAYCPPICVLALLVFLFTLLVPKGRREPTTDAPAPRTPEGRKRRF